MKARHKFFAKAVTIDGHRFASKAEGARYVELRLLEKAGEIRGLVLQPRFPLHVDGVLIGTYVADFAYDDLIGTYVADFDHAGYFGTRVVEDVKGLDLPLGRWKRKHFEAQYGQPVRVIRK